MEDSETRSSRAAAPPAPAPALTPSKVPARKVTAKDVARAAGVSATTVSYVLNNRAHQSIPESTRRRVLEAAGRLGYAPSAAARALATGRSNLVLGLVSDWPVGDNMGQLFRRLTPAFAARGHPFVTHTTDPGDHGGAGTDLLWRSITPAAVVVFDDIDDAQLAAMHAVGIQATVLAFTASGTGRGELERVDREVGQLQVQHLVARGHRQLGYAWPDDPRLEAFARPRLAGVELACRQADLPAPDVRTVAVRGDDARAAVAAWRETAPAVTGVCAYNDATAFAILRGMRRLELSAPIDLAVIGVDDVPTSALAEPPLTTVNYDRSELAERLATAVDSAITTGSYTSAVFDGLVTLIERSTT
ncbi:LacI family transcriptional regulator [Microlunatus phosphovorus NM-1]|uniref:LacI family transcriptional regulator n=1 Tax=Microlunatus phosphovorus (strain ATCC 700054 / DSM 10555 / JCM 9379 / NBRC 101784 / NCIMB 13414 / VKM Ac-1990 / NM-1) TaxID=1032480 RepID=F5XL22_MICPN|nr:LacI family DNA-binding transcriptional regulator [Microlunatus phosphovorus]BAK33710.1 LacI family transcriptional regulator [Microlunatus phosphovorus NM-1]